MMNRRDMAAIILISRRKSESSEVHYFSRHFELLLHEPI
jgi:hypothetical protein